MLRSSRAASGSSPCMDSINASTTRWTVRPLSKVVRVRWSGSIWASTGKPAARAVDINLLQTLSRDRSTTITGRAVSTEVPYTVRNACQVQRLPPKISSRRCTTERGTGSSFWKYRGGTAKTYHKFLLRIVNVVIVCLRPRLYLAAKRRRA